MKQKYDITVAGISLSIVSEDDEEYINSLVRLLDRRIADMTINKGKCSKGAALAVCALDYLDSSLKLQAELDAIKSGK
ncbi:MAG: cell division protein ZapA [Firmicutes bacterium]|nr:cell division protein ZapA [Candidatus Colimorpha enterica]MDD6322707.1 cell division protein ZapA [Bacillota bacterium]MDY2906593.1 cell division protein ZapA [Eubacteriales bacterium]